MTYTRDRKRSRNVSIGFLGTRIPGDPSTVKYDPGVNCYERCVDQTHPGPPYRTGGPLVIEKYSVKRTPSDTFFVQSTLAPVASYNGRLIVADALYTPVIPPAFDYSAYGAIGWNRTLPDHPVASLAVSIIELREMPRLLLQSRDFFRRLGDAVGSPTKKTVGDFLFDSRTGKAHAGGDYLATVFGWLPFLNDLYTVLNYREVLDRKLAYLRRKNNTDVRRSMVLDETSRQERVHTGGSTITSLVPSLVTKLYSKGLSAENQLIVDYEYKRRIWYEARYFLHMPESAFLEKPGFLGLTSLERQLLGLELNASVIYNALPWTWLLDWFTNAGDVVENLVSRQKAHVGAKYAYIMCSEEHKWTYRGTCETYLESFQFSSAATPRRRHYAQTVITKTYKGRQVANPYGFGITDDSLSAYQWSILGALGLTRLR